MRKVIRDTVPVQIPIDYDPSWIWEAVQDSRIVEMIRKEEFHGECFIEHRMFTDTTRATTIDPATAGFIIRDISVSVLGEIRASVEWCDLTKLHVLQTYGNLNYVARMFGYGDDPAKMKGTLITIDCIAKKS